MLYFIISSMVFNHVPLWCFPHPLTGSSTGQKYLVSVTLTCPTVFVAQVGHQSEVFSLASVYWGFIWQFSQGLALCPGAQSSQSWCEDGLRVLFLSVHLLRHLLECLPSSKCWCASAEVSRACWWRFISGFCYVELCEAFFPSSPHFYTTRLKISQNDSLPLFKSSSYSSPFAFPHRFALKFALHVIWLCLYDTSFSPVVLPFLLCHTLRTCLQDTNTYKSK